MSSDARLLAVHPGTDFPSFGGDMLIAVEGCMGVGKTTVARGLGKLRQSIVLLEDFESNPFLKSFYEDPVQNAIETEFAFPLLHFGQLRKLSDPALASQEVIADFHIWKILFMLT